MLNANGEASRDKGTDGLLSQNVSNTAEERPAYFLMFATEERRTFLLYVTIASY